MKLSLLARNWTVLGNTIEGTNATEFLYQGYLLIDPTNGPFLTALTADQRHLVQRRKGGAVSA